MCRARFKLFSFIQFIGCPNNLEHRVPRSVQPLLAYLLLYRTRFHNRQVLSEALWNGPDHNRAQRRLSTSPYTSPSPLNKPPASINQPLVKKPTAFIGNTVNPPSQRCSKRHLGSLCFRGFTVFPINVVGFFTNGWFIDAGGLWRGEGDV